MTYNVSSGTLSLYTTTTSVFCERIIIVKYVVFCGISCWYSYQISV